MSVSLSTSSYTTIMITPDQKILRKNWMHMPKTMMTIMMMMMMMIMTDPFTTNLVVKGPVAKGSVVKGATSCKVPKTLKLCQTSAPISPPSLGNLFLFTDLSSSSKWNVPILNFLSRTDSQVCSLVTTRKREWRSNVKGEFIERLITFGRLWGQGQLLLQNNW